METTNDIGRIADDLFQRLEGEIENHLRVQMEKIGVTDGAKRFLYPDDPDVLCSYEYNGKPILGVRIIDNGIVFDMPEIETQKGEVQ